MIVNRDLQILRLVSSFDLQVLIIQRNLVFKYHATFSSTAVYFSTFLFLKPTTDLYSDILLTSKSERTAEKAVSAKNVE